MDPLIGKAYRGALHHPDDVFDLPEAMSTHMVAGKVSKQAEQMAKLVPVVSSSNEQLMPDKQPHISLVRLLYNCWGKEFFAIGLLKPAAVVAKCVLQPRLLSRRFPIYFFALILLN